MRAILVEKGWLKRTVQIELREHSILLTYNGQGLGHEQVLIDGQTACRAASMF